MVVYVNIKQAGSRKKALDRVPYEIEFEKGTLGELIAVFAGSEAEKYNDRQRSAIDNAAFAGADDRLRGYDIRPRFQDVREAVKTALDGFNDGIVRIMLNEKELKDINEEITVSEGDVFTFIRLTFLAGRMW